MTRQASQGFTLIEVVVALAVGAMVLVTAHVTLEETISAIARLETERRNLDRRSNGRRFLSRAFANLESGPEAGGFNGSPHGIDATTWALGTSGFERQSVTLRLRSDSLVAVIGSHSPPRRRIGEHVLDTGVTALNVDYLLDFGAAAPWLPAWSSEVRLPLAVRVRLRYATPMHTDTLLYIVGTRG